MGGIFMNVNNRDVGQRIKQIRLTKGMTLEEFGKLFNASKGSVQGWESGRNLPNPERLRAIAKIGDTSVDELLYGHSAHNNLRRIVSSIINGNIDEIAFSNMVKAFHSVPDLEPSINLIAYIYTNNLTQRVLDDPNTYQIKDALTLYKYIKERKKAIDQWLEENKDIAPGEDMLVDIALEQVILENVLDTILPHIPKNKR
jgi:putative DNA-binding phage protein